MPAVLHAFLTHLELALRLHAAVPTLSVPDAYVHASAAMAASTSELRPELLLAIAFVESRFDTTATSRIERGKRKTGRFPSTLPPRDLDPRGTLYCGPLQTFAGSWAACLAMREPRVAYAAGAAEMSTWLRDRRVRGDLRRALAGHGCGNHGVLTGRCNGYPGRVLRIERRLRAKPPQV